MALRDLKTCGTLAADTYIFTYLNVSHTYLLISARDQQGSDKLCHQIREACIMWLKQ